jgi:signal transduction histidine kinase
MALTTHEADPTNIQRYGVAILTSLCALLITFLLWPAVDPAGAPLLFAAVMVSAWYGGLGPGLLATAISIFAKAYFFLPPHFSLAIGVGEILRLAVFVMVALLISSLNDARKRADAERAVSLAREREARAEAEAANHAKDEFLATVTHDLRGPLSTILGWVRVWRAGRLDESGTAKVFEVVERSAQAQLLLVNDLLDVSRIVMGEMRIAPRPIELPPVINTAIDHVRPATEAKNIHIMARLSQEVGEIQGDPDRLSQVFENLLSNAVKFTPEGGRIEVRLDRAGSQARIAVSDTGRGISQEFLPYVFDRFSQADPADARKHGGLGLGLAIVRSLVELHGGSVRVESDGVGQGATFTVMLPLAAEPPQLEEAGRMAAR